MERFKTSESIQSVATHHPDAELRCLLSARIESLTDLLDEFPLSDLMHVIVLDAGDTTQTLETALCVPILTNKLGPSKGLDLPLGDPAFVPTWEVCEVHAQWYEITFVLSSNGFGVVVYVPKASTDATLLALCERFAQAPHSLVSTSPTIKEPHAT